MVESGFEGTARPKAEQDPGRRTLLQQLVEIQGQANSELLQVIKDAEQLIHTLPSSVRSGTPHTGKSEQLFQFETVNEQGQPISLEVRLEPETMEKQEEGTGEFQEKIIGYNIDIREAHPDVPGSKPDCVAIQYRTPQSLNQIHELPWRNGTFLVGIPSSPTRITMHADAAECVFGYDQGRMVQRDLSTTGPDPLIQAQRALRLVNTVAK